ncbi:hypothetical protein HPP92_015904 [Vanilla planifolia]|uniref:SWIM-type domain-containing protein n=1 Tax=Vanilla planifolia TaxID=51239 RepID=A0A835QSH3_VANPL|nr:hypothetical protein HPP92_015904 [Vanilla planifolia]
MHCTNIDIVPSNANHFVNNASLPSSGNLGRITRSKSIHLINEGRKEPCQGVAFESTDLISRDGSHTTDPTKEEDSNANDPDWNSSGEEDDEDFISDSIIRNTCRGLDEDPISCDSILYVGKVFKDKEVLKQALQEYSIRRHVEYQVMRTTKKIYNVRCIQKGCPWQVRSRLGKRLQKFKIKYYGGEHTCIASTSVGDHKQCDGKFISKCIIPLVKRRSTVTPAEIIEWMKNEYDVKISYSKAWIGLNKALKKIHGSWDDSYAMLQEYLKAIQEANPGTVVQLLTNEKGDVRQFNRLFWSFGASIEGFRHLRPLITIDSAELHGKYSGSLLVATGIDGNDGLFPLAFAIAESETEETWNWFLRCIRNSVTDRDDITIISDRGRGLMDAVKSVYPSRFTSHRYCMRQLSCSLRKEFKDEILVNLFWEAARKTESCEFDEIMKILGERNPEARRWLEKAGVENWSFAHDGGKRFGLMTTNIVETCDSLLKGVRGLPIKALVGKTLSRLSKIFNKRLEEGSRMLGILTSSVESQLSGVANFAEQHMVEPYSSTLFKVYRVNCRPHTVSTEGYTCTCNRYPISGIPCSHIVAVCIGTQLSYHNLCAAYFSSQIYRQTYAAKLHPVDEETACPSQEGAPITPPAMARKRGRPPSARINKGLPPATYRCSKCKKDGHNYRTCKSSLSLANDAAQNSRSSNQNDR